MSPGRNDCGPEGTEPQGKTKGQTDNQHLRPLPPQAQSIRVHGLRHVSFAVQRARNRLARLIATRDQVFSSDMSLVVDRLTVENESLRERLRSVA